LETRPAPCCCINCSASDIVSSFHSASARTERPSRANSVPCFQRILLCRRMARRKYSEALQPTPETRSSRPGASYIVSAAIKYK
jgi:hypothetical protein